MYYTETKQVLFGVVSGISLYNSNYWLHDLKGINFLIYNHDGQVTDNYKNSYNLGGNPNNGDVITLIFDLRPGQDNLRVIRNGIDLGRVADYITKNCTTNIYMALSMFDARNKIELKSYI
jgi:hypothetical protein